MCVIWRLNGMRHHKQVTRKNIDISAKEAIHTTSECGESGQIPATSIDVSLTNTDEMHLMEIAIFIVDKSKFNMNIQYQYIYTIYKVTLYIIMISKIKLK